MAEDIALLRTRVYQLMDQLELAEKKNRAYRNEVHRAARDLGQMATCDASEYAQRRREEILKRAVDIDCGKGI